MAIFTDIELAVMAETLKDDHDRKVSVPALRDFMTIVEDEIFRRLAKPEATFTLGRVCKLTVEELDIPDQPRQIDEPREFYLCAIDSDELQRAIEDAADFVQLPPPPVSLVDLAKWDVGQLIKKNRRIARGEQPDNEEVAP